MERGTGLAPGERAGESAGERDELLAEAARRARRYLDQVAGRAVAPAPAAIGELARLGGRLPAGPRPGGEVLALLDDVGSPATVANAGPRFFGFVNGGALPVAVAASWLLAAWDQNAALGVMSPAAAYLEETAIRWVAELLGLPESAGGGFVTGATMANLTCLATARDAVLERAGWDPSAGLFGAPPIQVVAGEQAHTTLFKALGLAGLGRDRVTLLPADEQGRIVASTLPQLHGPAIVCLQAGNVNSGASDPFGPLIEWAAGEGAWVHVDGAFGLWAAASPERAGQVAGVSAADSWGTDAHKWLNTTYDCGIALVRDPAALGSAMRATASYLPESEYRDPMRFTPQSSQRARGAEVWAVLASLGRDGVADLVDRACRLAGRFAAGLAGAGLEVLNDVVLNQVVVDLGAPERAAAAVAAIQAGGTCWCGPTYWRGRNALRISVSNWSTTEADVDASIRAIAAAVR